MATTPTATWSPRCTAADFFLPFNQKGLIFQALGIAWRYKSLFSR
jgi:hypothetical protein